MNLIETIKNIRATCNNYVDPDLLAFIIDDENYMGTNDILEVEGYNITDYDSYEERLLKISRSENIFLPLGMMTFMPVLNECDIFSENDYNLQLTPEEFEKYGDNEEKLFGILVKKIQTNILSENQIHAAAVLTHHLKNWKKQTVNFITP